MEKVTLTIDDREVVTAEGTSILQAALQSDIYIPHLCYHPELKPAGVCRLCIVESGGEELLSCRTPVREGMVVRTRTPEIDQARRVNIEILVANHHLICKGCAGNKNCVLQQF